MTINKNKKMFNIDEREKFKVRKSKKYKNLCSIAMGVLAISGLASAPASADELLSSSTPSVVIVTEKQPAEELIAHPAPSTNLTEVQPEVTIEAAKIYELTDTESGAITVTNESSKLNQAVSTAQQAGIIVIEKSAKDYGSTLSVEETEKKQAEIAKDYENQATIINEVTAGYIAEKEKHSKATLAIIDFNNQLKEQYDAKIAEYNTDVLKVNAQNAAIDAAYDVARQAYEAEVLQIETYNADAKVKYEEAYQRYQAETQRILQLNEYKKQKYHTDLSEFNKEVVKVNEDNQKLESDYQAAYAAYEAELDRIKSTNASKESAYNQALETYRFEVERINRENEEKRKNFESQQGSATEAEAENRRLEAEYNTAYKAYEEALARVQSANQTSNQAYQDALTKYRLEVERINRENEAKRLAYEEVRRTFETTSGNVEAENQLIKQRNQEAQEVYDRAMTVYRSEKERYDRAVSEFEAKKSAALSANERIVLTGSVDPETTGLAHFRNLSAIISSDQPVDLLKDNLYWTNQTAVEVIKGFRAYTSADGKPLDTPSDYTYTGWTVGDQLLIKNVGQLANSETVDLLMTVRTANGTSTHIPNILAVLKDPLSDGIKFVVFGHSETLFDYTVTTKDGRSLTVAQSQIVGDVDYGQHSRLTYNGASLLYNPKGSGLVPNGTGGLKNSPMHDVHEYNQAPLGTYVVVGYGDTISYYHSADDDNLARTQEERDRLALEDRESARPHYIGYAFTLFGRSVSVSTQLISTPPKEPTLRLEKEKTSNETPPPEPVYEVLPKEPLPDGQIDVPKPPSKPNLVIPERPQEPTYEALPKEPTVSYLNTPEAPTKPTPKVSPKEPTAPTYESLPIAPTVTYKETPRAPQKDPSVPLPPKPEEPTYKELPKAPKTPTVTYNLATLATQPQTSKEVETTEGVNVDKGLVAKGQDVVFELLIDSLSANRALTTSGEITDPLPTGFELDFEKTVNANSAYELTYSTDKHTLVGNFTKELILSTNRDLTKSITLPSLKVYGRVLNDAATYKNTFTLVLNGGQGKVNGYTRTSNTVVVHTPGDPNDPDNPTNNEINPLKANTNATGVKIDGKVVPIGGINYYQITLDYDQYQAITADKVVIKKGFGAFDDYPEAALIPDLTKVSIVDSDGKVVSGLKLADNLSIAASDQLVKEHLSNSGIGQKIKGAFISILAENPQAYYDNIIKAKKSVTITIPMQVKDSLYNTGQSYSNTAYQLDFGNGYMTNTVSNTTPVVEPSKVNTNAEGININGKYVLANSVNYYKVDLNYSAYKGIEADANLISLGFFGVDDLPEEALNVEMSGIQFHASDNTVAKGITSTIYKNIAEAPKVLQDAFAKRNFAPKGAVLVMSADDSKAYYDTYVKTGMSITATLPMTVKAELAKTGGTYENTAYQIDFGTAYITETVVNNVPKLDPKKDVVIDLSHDGESLVGKDIEVGTVFNYKLAGAELPANRGSEIFSYTWYDNYDEEHDQYDGIYKIFATVAFETEDGTKYAAGTELTRFSIQTLDTKKGEVLTKLDESFLRSITDSSAFKADKYMQVKRIATGDVHNTYTHGVNGAEVGSNTITTHTPVGNVIVNFIEDGTGKVLKPQVTDEKEVATGTTYDTSDRKVTEIVTEDGKTYELVRTEGQETGKVVKGDIVVDYIYKEVLGSVTVNYKDTDGNVIKVPVVDTPEGSTGRDYDTTDNKPIEIVTEDGKTFELVRTEGQETGKVVKGDTVVDYIYKEVLGSVTVNYKDTDGNVIKLSVVDTPEGSTGRDYDTTDNRPTEIVTKDGKTYQIVPELTKGNETGKVVKGDTVITYFYKEVLGDVVVNYKDTNGKVIKESVTDTPLTSTGTAYDTKDNKPETIVRPDGSSFRLVPAKTVGAEEGKIVRGRTEVTYVYEEILGSVSVGYTDKDGNVIKEPVVDTPTGSTGRDYDTTDNKPKEIVTKDGKTYQIVPELTKGNEKGKVVEGDTKITYVYEEIKADVIVHYVDEAGNVIKKPVKDTEQASTGTDYDTTDNKPEYIDVDGVRYKLMPKKTIGNETGQLTKEGAEVTYVYHKIVTNWVTEEDRKPLKPQEDGEKEKGSFEGRTFVVTEVDPETGDITHVFKKVPVPQTPTPPVTPAPVTLPAASVVKSATLPDTGEVESSVLTAAGLAVFAASAGLTVTKRRKEDN